MPFVLNRSERLRRQLADGIIVSLDAAEEWTPPLQHSGRDMLRQ
jgi:hypothetical protein